MDQSELQKLVEDTSLEYFGLPFQHTATFNSRLRTTGGRYHLRTHDLDFNQKILDVSGMSEFVGVIKHELCHYHLHLTGQGFQHKDRDFKELLEKVGGSRYAPAVREPNKPKSVWMYQCQKCTASFYRQRRFNTKKYVCGKCKGRLELVDRQNVSALTRK